MANSAISKPRINEMGSEVVEGYACKPKDFDPNRAMMHYKTLLLLCDDERCAKAGGENKAAHLRDIVRQMGLQKGKRRIKIARTKCYGACRFRQVCLVQENMQANGNATNCGLWLRHTHRFDDARWRAIFLALSEDRPLKSLLHSSDFIEQKIYS